MRLGKLVTAAVASALVLTACTQGDTTTPVDPDPSETTDAPDPDQPGEDTPIAVFFVRSAPDRFYVEPEFQSGGNPDLDGADAASEALTRLFDASMPGSDTAPTDPELFTSVPDGVSVISVSLDGGTLTIDLAGFAGTSGASAQETTMLLQVAHTATFAAGAAAVQLTFDGEVQEELWGHVDVSGVMEVSDFDVSPVIIENPTYGASVAVGDVTFDGTALVFEATVEIVIINDATGATAHSGFVTASAGGPERGTWTFTFTFDTPGTYTLTATESDPSDGEGRPPFSASRTITVG